MFLDHTQARTHTL